MNDSFSDDIKKSFDEMIERTERVSAAEEYYHCYGVVLDFANAEAQAGRVLSKQLLSIMQIIGDRSWSKQILEYRGKQ